MVYKQMVMVYKEMKVIIWLTNGCNLDANQAKQITIFWLKTILYYNVILTSNFMS